VHRLYKAALNQVEAELSTLLSGRSLYMFRAVFMGSGIAVLCGSLLSSVMAAGWRCAVSCCSTGFWAGGGAALCGWWWHSSVARAVASAGLVEEPLLNGGGAVLLLVLLVCARYGRLLLLVLFMLLLVLGSLRTAVSKRCGAALFARCRPLLHCRHYC
jgi:hypothetical protein